MTFTPRTKQQVKIGAGPTASADEQPLQSRATYSRKPVLGRLVRALRAGETDRRVKEYLTGQIQ